MDHEKINDNLENASEAHNRPTDILEDLADEFDQAAAEENINERTKELQAEATAEQKEISLSHEAMPFGEIVGPATPVWDKYLSRHRPKLRKSEQFKSKEFNAREWEDRIFKLDHPNIEHAGSHDMMEWSVTKYFEYGDHSEKTKQESFNNALENALAFYDDDCNDAWERYSNPQAARSLELQIVQEHMDRLREWPHGKGMVDAIEAEVNFAIIQGKISAITRALSRDRFMMPGARKALEEELTLLQKFDSDKYLEERKSPPEFKLETLDENPPKEQDNTTPKSAEIPSEPETTEEQKTETVDEKETEEQPEGMPSILSDPEAYIAAVTMQKLLDSTKQQLHAKDEELEKKIEDYRKRKENDELAPDEMPPITAEIASIDAIDHLERLAETMDKKDILNMIYGEDWVKNYDKIVDALFNGDRFQAGQEMIRHMSSEEISGNLGAILDMIDKNDDSFPIRLVIQKLSDYGQRGISPQEKTILARYGYDDYALKSLGA